MTVQAVPDPEIAERFRRALRGVASSVTIITANDGTRRHGMTATAVMSVSMSPPALAVCINRATLLHEIISASDRFCVNFLSEEQEPLSAAFSGAVAPAERFGHGTWAFDDAGLGWLRDAQANIVCAKVAALAYGTHSLFLGEVLDVRATEASGPLLYHDSLYCRSLPRVAA